MTDSNWFANQRVLITGASGGIGSELVTQLGTKGASVLLSGRDENRLRTLAETLPEKQRLGWVAGDLLTPAGLNKLIRTAELRRISTLVNLQGINDFGLFEAQDYQQLEAVLTTNLRSPLMLTRALLPLLRSTEDGLIVNVGSVFGSIGHAGYVAYCASKFGMRGFTEALQRELADSALDVVYVAPRATQTHMNDVAGARLNEALGSSEDSPALVAEEILHAMRRRKRRHFVGSPEKFFARINQLFPSLVDRALRAKLPVIKQHAHTYPTRKHVKCSHKLPRGN